MQQHLNQNLVKQNLEMSIEFFPPKTAKAEADFWPVVEQLASEDTSSEDTSREKLDFISITYGAGGSTKDNSIRIAETVQQKFNIPVAMHLTCVDASRQEINDIAMECWRRGIKRLVALRGDPKDGVAGTYQSHPDGYAYASDLMEGLKKLADFDISAAAYPEKHPQALSMADDILALKKKQDAGANRALTQFFFHNELFYRFREMATKAGISMPIIPGVLPIHNLAQTLKFATACGAHIPEHYQQLLDTKIDAEERQLLAAHLFLQQCADLKNNGVEGFHFYGMNRVQPVKAAIHLLQQT